MRINAELIVKLRKDKAWSQDELAIACPACKSDNIYQYKEYFQYTGNGEELNPLSICVSKQESQGVLRLGCV